MCPCPVKSVLTCPTEPPRRAVCAMFGALIRTILIWSILAKSPWLQKCGVLRESDGCRVAYRVPQQSGEWILELQTMVREDFTISEKVYWLIAATTAFTFKTLLRHYTMLTNLPVPYDFCVCNPTSQLLTVGSTPGILSLLVL